MIYCVTFFVINFPSIPPLLSHFCRIILCSCVDCQSRYFDCEFDQNENDTRQDHSDGGLGAGNFNYGLCVIFHSVP